MKKKRKKFDKSKAKNMVFVLSIYKDEEYGDSINLNGAYESVEEAEKSIQTHGMNDEEYRIFEGKFKKRIKLNAKIKEVKE